MIICTHKNAICITRYDRQEMGQEKTMEATLDYNGMYRVEISGVICWFDAKDVEVLS